MADKDAIITLPNADLRQQSKRVGVITEEIRGIIDDMKSATLDWEKSRSHEVGVALAAVQIDVLLRIVIIRENIDDKNNHQFKVFINPEITKLEGEKVEDYEGCLSIKDIYGKVPRYSRVRIKATDEQGRPFTMKLNGFLARVMQHEIDHTKGIVFIDHIKDNHEAFFRLEKDGALQQLDYEADIKNNRILW